MLWAKFGGTSDLRAHEGEPRCPRGRITRVLHRIHPFTSLAALFLGAALFALLIGEPMIAAVILVVG
jgi:hypothetical protein